MSRRRALMLAELLLLSVSGFATGVLEQPEAELSMQDAEGERVVIRGVLSFYGNEPVTFLGILATSDGNQDIIVDPELSLAIEDETLFELTGELLPELQRWQATRVEITGTLERAPQGPGIPAQILVEGITLPDR